MGFAACGGVRPLDQATLTAFVGTSNAGLAPVAAVHLDGALQQADTPSIDVPAAERAVHDLLIALGRDVSAPGLRDTPRRVAAAYAELLTQEPFSLATFPKSRGCAPLSRSSASTPPCTARSMLRSARPTPRMTPS